MKIRIYIAVVFLMFAISLQAQDFRQLVEAMHKDFGQSKRLQIVMEVTVYGDATTETPYYQQLVDIRKEDSNYWYGVEDTEMLLNDKYLIVVDRRSQQISCSKRDLKAETEFHKAYQFNVDSILSLYETPRYLGTGEDGEHYMVSETKGEIEEIHFFIDAQRPALKKMSYKYKEGQVATIKFLVFEKVLKFKEGTFSETKYVSTVNGNMVPSRYFRQYKLNYR